MPAVSATSVQKSPLERKLRLTARTMPLDRPGAPEDALRADDERDDEGHEPHADLPARGDEERGPLGGEAEDDAPGERTVRVADPAEDHGREDREQEGEAQLRRELRHGAGQHAGQAGERAREDPRVEDDPGGVDPG